MSYGKCKYDASAVASAAVAHAVLQIVLAFVLDWCMPTSFRFTQALLSGARIARCMVDQNRVVSSFSMKS